MSNAVEYLGNIDITEEVHFSEVAPSGKTRRGLVLYDKNPFIGEAVANTKTGVKHLTAKGGNRMMVIAEKTGEYIAPAGFYQSEEVDKSKFIKLFINGVRAFKDLTNAGTRVFEVLYGEMQEKINSDKVYLSYSAIDPSSMSQATFTRGMRELIDKRFIAPMASTSWYYVNPDFVWNGDRLSFVKEYRKASSKPVKDQTAREKLEAEGQKRLIE